MVPVHHVPLTVLPGTGATWVHHETRVTSYFFLLLGLNELNASKSVPLDECGRLFCFIDSIGTLWARLTRFVPGVDPRPLFENPVWLELLLLISEISLFDLPKALVELLSDRVQTNCLLPPRSLDMFEALCELVLDVHACCEEEDMDDCRNELICE